MRTIPEKTEFNTELLIDLVNRINEKGGYLYKTLEIPEETKWGNVEIRKGKSQEIIIIQGTGKVSADKLWDFEAKKVYEILINLIPDQSLGKPGSKED